MKNLSSDNPTEKIDLHFGNYFQTREQEINAHLVNGIPDYAFSLDQKLRQQLAAMGPVRAIAKSLVSMIVPIYRQIQQMDGIAVSPQQYPEVYKMGEECARILGIGIPQIFIYYSPMINAYTIATDDLEPIVILSSAIVEALTPDELKFVIGHECGHIHNLHGVYNTAVELMTNSMAGIIFASVPGLSILKTLIQGSLSLFMFRWSRCAEITCDRAGLICCGDLITAQTALAKLTTGGVNKLDQINIQEYIKQISQVQATPLRFKELFSTHPLIHKRIEALRLFSECAVLATWGQEMTMNNLRSKEETDNLCEQFIKVAAQGYQAESTSASVTEPKTIQID
jgi:Zn-dependent protease with chaperone function